MRIARLPIPRRFCAQIVTPVNIPHGLETAMAAGRFPLPYSAEVTPHCFLVLSCSGDVDGQALAHVFESEPGWL